MNNNNAVLTSAQKDSIHNLLTSIEVTEEEKALLSVEPILKGVYGLTPSRAKAFILRD